MRFNKPVSGSTRTLNHEGDVAYTLSPQLDLYSAVVTTALSDKFYESSDDRMDRIRQLVKKNDPEFVAKLAVYARETMYLRSVPVALAVELARVHSGDSLVSKTIARVVQRADEITELLAYYAGGRTGSKKLNKLSKQVQKGLAAAFNKFDEYAFGKYDRDTAIKLRDALFLVHPRAKDDAQQGLFDKIIAGTLETPYTWETQLTEAGKTGRAKKDVWEELIASGEVKYMALLRNLRNILEADVSPEVLKTVATRVSDPAEVLRSKQFPFRFFSAYRELQEVHSPRTSVLLDALDEAMVVSAANIEGFDEGTSVFIAGDVSGSMGGTISERSKVRTRHVGLVLGMLLQSRCKAVMTGAFATTFRMLNLPRKGILGNVSALDNLQLGGGTNGQLVLRSLLDGGHAVDKVMIFTDCQLWDDTSNGGGATFRSAWHEYKTLHPDANLYIFDLAGYGNTPLSTCEKDVYFVSGWSDRIFSVLAALERGSSAVEEIEGIAL